MWYIHIYPSIRYHTHVDVREAIHWNVVAFMLYKVTLRLAYCFSTSRYIYNRICVTHNYVRNCMKTVSQLPLGPLPIALKPFHEKPPTTLRSQILTSKWGHTGRCHDKMCPWSCKGHDLWIKSTIYLLLFSEVWSDNCFYGWRNYSYYGSFSFLVRIISII
jgi:hypothetical protein